LNECQAVELANGDVMINSRNHGVRLNNRGVCVSHDGGQTFDPKLFRRDKTLVEPQCQASIRRYAWPKGGKPGLILYSGPGVATSRAQGTLRGSYDEGKTWPWKLLYYQGPSGYSDIAVLPDGRVAILFEKDGKDKLGFTILPAPPAYPAPDLGEVANLRVWARAVDITLGADRSFSMPLRFHYEPTQWRVPHHHGRLPAKGDDSDVRAEAFEVELTMHPRQAKQIAVELAGRTLVWDRETQLLDIGGKVALDRNRHDGRFFLRLVLQDGLLTVFDLVMGPKAKR